MQIAKIEINNFRGVKQAELLLPRHGVLIGDNNAGKTTLLEALDLVLGPDCNDPAFSAHIMPLKRMPGQGFSSSTPDVGADDCKR